MASEDPEKLKCLEERLEKLEKLVYSNNPQNAHDENLTAHLLRISQSINEAERSNGNLHKIYSQLDELKKYTALCHGNTIDKPVDAKINFIEASEDQLRSQAKQLESVEKLKWVLESEHLKSRVTADLNTRLHRLSQIHNSNTENANTSLEQAKGLIDNYNTVISNISKQFERWNALVSHLEEQKSV